MEANYFIGANGLGKALDRCRRALCGIALFVALGGVAEARVATNGDAAQFVAQVGNEIISVLGAPNQAVSQRHRKFRNIFDRALDLDTMARRVLGRHWRTATDSQKTRYVRLFRQYVLRIYAVQLGVYAGEKFSVLRQQSSNATETLVVARITRQYGAPLELSFRVRQTGKDFRIVDMTVGGVSLIVTKRSEFDSIIRREGLPGLLRRLNSKSSARYFAPSSGSLLARAISEISRGSILIIR